MKLKLVALTLIAFVCWLVPLKTLAQETGKPKLNTETQTKPPEPYVSEDIVIKDNAIQPLKQFQIPVVSKERIRVSDRRDNPTYAGTVYSKEEVQQLIRDYSAQYGISANLPLRIAQCESGFNQFSKNKSSTASGVFQWLSSSWANQPASQNNTVSVFDADKNVSAAVWLIAHGKTSPWNASRACWSNN